MRKTDILESLINFYTDGNKARFAAKIGVKPQTINTWLVRDTFDVDAIYSNCEGVSGDYLLSGEGNILKDENKDHKELKFDSKKMDIAIRLYDVISEIIQQQCLPNPT